MAHHQALTQHQAASSSGHQDIYQSRTVSSNSIKTDENRKNPSSSQMNIKEEQSHGNREKASETRLPVISMTSGYVFSLFYCRSFSSNSQLLKKYENFILET